MNKLPKEIVDQLTGSKEAGMAYQIGTATLSDGSSHDNVIVHDSSTVEAAKAGKESFDPADVVKFKSTHNDNH